MHASHSKLLLLPSYHGVAPPPRLASLLPPLPTRPAFTLPGQDYDWRRHAGKTVIDVGGGTGGALTAILRSRPDLKGVLFDTPQVIGEARRAPLPSRRPRSPPSCLHASCLRCGSRRKGAAVLPLWPPAPT